MCLFKLARCVSVLLSFFSRQDGLESRAIRPKLGLPSVLVILALALTAQIVSSGFAQADNAQYFYDPAGRLTAVVDPINGSAQYNYDAVGNIVSVVRLAPTDLLVAQVSPSSGAPGSTVTIFGTGFDTISDTTINFNGVAATPTSVSTTQIVATVPSGATSGPISVTAPGGTAASVMNFTVTSAVAPTISSVAPSPVSQSGTITISGTGFDPVANNDKVLINGRYASVVSASATSITATVPIVTSGYVSVTTPIGTATSSTYLVVPPVPNVASDVGGVTNSSIGSLATVNIPTAGQIGLILFDATAGQRMTMNVTANSLGGSFIALFGPDGRPVVPQANMALGTYVDAVVLPATGTYTVVINTGGGRTGSATVSLNSVPPDVTSTIAANGTAVSLSNTAAGQNMSLTFSGTAGQRISLLTQPTLGCSTAIIKMPDGITPLYSAFGICGNDFSDALMLPISGTYTISFDPNGTEIGSASFTLYGVPPDATSPITTDGTAVSMTTTVPGQNARATFFGAAGQRVSLLSQPGVCQAVALVGPDGTKLYSNFICGQDFSDVIVLPTAGLYTVLADPSGLTVGAITFQLYTVPPDVTGTIAAFGTPISLTTTTPGQNGSLTFAGTAGQRVSLVSEPSICEFIKIIAPDGVTQLYSNNICGSDFSGLLILPATGTYTISVDPNHQSTGAATFTLYVVPPDATGTISANGTAVTLTTTAPGQNGSLTFSGTAAQRISLVTQPNFCVAVEITAPNGTTQLYSNNVCGNDFSGVLVLATTGTYTISAFPNHANFGSTSFTLYTEPANASATITPGGGSVSLTTTVPGQQMSLTFSGTAGQRVSLFTEPSTCVGITITAPDGTTQVYSNFVCGNDFSDVRSLSQTGTYTISVGLTGANTGTATFTLYNVPPDTTGTTTVGQAAANYATTVPGQAIQVSFTDTSGQSVTVAVAAVSTTPSSVCYFITTLAPDGTRVRGDESCSSGYSSGSLGLTQNGTYTVIVKPTNAAFGTFSVGVSTP
jgi:YD repeat-containing protein